MQNNQCDIFCVIHNCSVLQLIVHLVDANDNSPVFDLSTYTNSTSEGKPIHSTLFSGKFVYLSVPYIE